MSVKGTNFTVRGSIADRLLEFFENNPDEELTIPDIQTKFGVSYTSVGNAIKRHGYAIELAHVVRLKAKGVAS